MDTIKKHEKCIELLEKIQSEELTKKDLTDSCFNVKNHFPHLAEKYIKQIEIIETKIINLQKKYKSCLKQLTNK